MSGGGYGGSARRCRWCCLMLTAPRTLTTATVMSPATTARAGSTGPLSRSRAGPATWSRATAARSSPLYWAAPTRQARWRWQRRRGRRQPGSALRETTCPARARHRQRGRCHLPADAALVGNPTGSAARRRRKPLPGKARRTKPRQGGPGANRPGCLLNCGREHLPPLPQAAVPARGLAGPADLRPPISVRPPNLTSPTRSRHPHPARARNGHRRRCGGKSACSTPAGCGCREASD